jgi:hypothetical protein
MGNFVFGRFRKIFHKESVFRIVFPVPGYIASGLDFAGSK